MFSLKSISWGSRPLIIITIIVTTKCFHILNMFFVFVRLYPPHSSSHNNIGVLLQDTQPEVFKFMFVFVFKWYICIILLFFIFLTAHFFRNTLPFIFQQEAEYHFEQALYHTPGHFRAMLNLANVHRFSLYFISFGSCWHLKQIPEYYWSCLIIYCCNKNLIDIVYYYSGWICDWLFYIKNLFLFLFILDLEVTIQKRISCWKDV